MENSKIFIPKKCKVGYNHRGDTYTGKLGYIIYHDGKIWRKEHSWEEWREKYITTEEYNDKKMEWYEKDILNKKNDFIYYKNKPKEYPQYANMNEDEFSIDRVGTYENYNPRLGKVSQDDSIKPFEFDNIPTEGFVLNKKVGGTTGHSWDQRATYCRVYDPRGFEFEITIPNLLYILENSNSIKGKGLSGKFIYGWEGKDLILIPEEAPEYVKMIEFTDVKNSKSISKKELIVGYSYLFDDLKEYVYIGNYHSESGDIYDSEKSMIFLFKETYNEYKTEKVKQWNIVISLKDTKKIKKCINKCDEFPEFIDFVFANNYCTDKELEYIELTQLKYNLIYYTTNIYNCFILNNKKYKSVYITVYSTDYSYHHSKFKLTIGREEYFYNTEAEMLKNHKLWQQKTIN